MLKIKYVLVFLGLLHVGGDWGKLIFLSLTSTELRFAPYRISVPSAA